MKFSGEQAELVDRLAEVKDAIGFWHDWLELDQIAQKQLQHSGKCSDREEIRSHAPRTFDTALQAANALRAQCFRSATKTTQRKTARSLLEAASKLAA